MGRDIRRRESPGMEGEQDQGLRRPVRQDAMAKEDIPDRLREGVPRHGFGPGLRVFQDQPLPLLLILGREQLRPPGLDPLIQGHRPDPQGRRCVPPPDFVDHWVQLGQGLHLLLEGVRSLPLRDLGHVLRGQPGVPGQGLIQPAVREGLHVRHVFPVLPAKGPDIHYPQGPGLVLEPFNQVHRILAPGFVRVREEDNLPPRQGLKVRVLGTPGTVQGGHPDTREEPPRRVRRLLPLTEEDQPRRVLGQPVQAVEGPGLGGLLGFPLAGGPVGPSDYLLAPVRRVIAPDNQEEPSVRVPIAKLPHGVTVAVREGRVPCPRRDGENRLRLPLRRRVRGRRGGRGQGHLRPSQGRQLAKGQGPGLRRGGVHHIGQETQGIHPPDPFQGEVRPCAGLQIEPE